MFEAALAEDRQLSFLISVSVTSVSALSVSVKYYAKHPNGNKKVQVQRFAYVKKYRSRPWEKTSFWSPEDVIKAKSSDKVENHLHLAL